MQCFLKGFMSSFGDAITVKIKYGCGGQICRLRVDTMTTRPLAEHLKFKKKNKKKKRPLVSKEMR